LNRYLPDTDRRKYHEELATFFAKLSNIDRKVEELPYHLQRAQKYRELMECLTNLSIFDKLYTPSNKFDLFRYWRTVIKNLSCDIVGAYREALNRHNFPSHVIVADLYYRVGQFLEDMGKYDGAEEVYGQTRFLYENNSQPIQVARVECSIARVYHLGELLIDCNNLKEAEANLNRALELRQKKLGGESALTTQTVREYLYWNLQVLGLARLRELQGNFDEALSLAKRALSIYEKLFGPDSVEVALVLEKMGQICNNQYKFEEAKPLLERAVKISETKFGTEHPRTADVVYTIGCSFLMQQSNYTLSPLQ
jgi:tetratricopeptide (TPR) repeat protein